MTHASSLPSPLDSVLAARRACLTAQADVVVDRFEHCLACGFERYSHEPHDQRGTLYPTHTDNAAIETSS